MKSIMFNRHRHGGLEFREAAVPKARGSQIVVKIHASSLNPHDWKYYDSLKQMYKLPLGLPALTLGHDLSGTVVEVGGKVNRFMVNDEVYAMSAKTGAFGEFLAFDHRMAARKPSSLSHPEAASMPMAALTAWQSFMLAKLSAGDSVLIIGGSGGVGSLAVQIAKAKGASVTAVCGPKNRDLVASLGAERIIDYTRENVLDAGLRFDVVYDTIGTLTPWAASRILKPQGRFVCTAPHAGVFLGALLSRIPGVPIKTTSTLLALPIGRHLEDIGALVDAGVLRPVIDRQFPIESIDEAIAYSKTGRARGKIVLTIQ